MDVFRLVFGPKFAAQFPNVIRWFNTCVNQAEFSKVIGKVEFAKEDGAAPKAAKAEKAKAEKPAAAAKPAAEKKEAAPKEAAAAAPKGDNDDLLDEMEAPKIKKANPLDALPPSSMDLDTTKKLAFSQRPFLPDFFEKLWRESSWRTATHSLHPCCLCLCCSR